MPLLDLLMGRRRILIVLAKIVIAHAMGIALLAKLLMMLMRKRPGNLHPELVRDKHGRIIPGIFKQLNCAGTMYYHGVYLPKMAAY